jgi:hypothetical protein
MDYGNLTSVADGAGAQLAYLGIRLRNIGSAFAALLIAAGFTAPAGLIALLIGTVAFGLVKFRARKLRFRRTFELVELQIRRTITQPQAALPHDNSQSAAS